MKRHPRRTLLAVLAVLGLLLSACGGDDGDATEDTSSAADDSTTTEAGDDAAEDEDDDPADEQDGEDPGEGDDEGVATDDEGDSGPAGDPAALATAAHPTVDDFPEGYEGSDDDQDDDAGFRDCITTPGGDQPLAEAGSTTFTLAADGASGDEDTVSVHGSSNITTVVYDSADTAGAVVDEIATDTFVGCAEGFIDQGFGASPGATSLEASVDDPPVGEQSVSLTGAFAPPAADGAAAISIHAVRTGPVLAFVAVLDVTGGDTVEQVVADSLTAVGVRHAALG